MRKIAHNTVKEFLRNRVVHILLGITLFFVLASIIVSQLSIAEQEKIIIDFSLMIIEICGLILTLFFGSQLISSEKKKKTLYLVLSRTHNITSFIVGKFLGFAIVLCLYMGISLVVYMCMSLGYDLMGYIGWGWSILAFLFIYLKLLVILALVILFSTFVSNMVALFCGFIIYIISHILPFLKRYALEDAQSGIVSHGVINIIYFLFPNFEQLSLKEFIFTPFLSQIPFSHFFALIFWHLIYIVIVLMISIMIFKRTVRKG